LVLAFVLFAPIYALAQSPTPQPAAPDQQLLKPEQLDALVAPIALYPDTLLAMVLMASTYPLEVVQAERWASQNAKLKDDQLKAAVEKQPWDESIKSLVATPAVLTMMSTKLDWTQSLGDAVSQRLTSWMQSSDCAKACEQQAAFKQATDRHGEQMSSGIISIAPTEPNTIYVLLQSGVVYGSWPYPAYPPYYFGYPGYIAGASATGRVCAGYARRWAPAELLGRWHELGETTSPSIDPSISTMSATIGTPA
jgi:hypothetical protein